MAKPFVAKFSISLLGPFQAGLDGVQLYGFRSAKVRALLAYLAVESHRPWSRTVIADLLWPDLSDKDAQSNLRNAISNLRKVLEDKTRDPPFLLISQDTLQFNQSTSTQIDVNTLLQLVPTVNEVGVGVLRKIEIDGLEQVLTMYRGDFMEGLNIASAPFEEWVLHKSEQTRRKVVEILRLLVINYENNIELDHALRHAQHWVELEPWDEAAYRHLMQILHSQGQRNAALAQFEACRQRLKKDLDIEPESATVQMYDRIRNGQVDFNSGQREIFLFSQKGELPGFLKDMQLTQPEDTLFVARQKELERLDIELTKALHGQGRILFVTGDPGSGKTALLAEFARKAAAKYSDLIVAWGQCNAYTGVADPYFPFLEIIQTLGCDVKARVLGGAISPEHARRLWKILPDFINAILEEGPDLINRFLSGQDLLALAKVNQHLKPELITRLQYQVDHTSQRPIQSLSQQVTLFNQFTNVFSNISQQAPMVLILDDLQWIDMDSINLFFHFGRRLFGSRILLLGAYRPEEIALGSHGERHPLEGVIHELKTSHGYIHIDLMQNEGIDFIEALLDSEPNQLSPLFHRQLHRHTGGHPLFTIELLRGMQLRGDIYHNQKGKWVDGTHLNWDFLPVRVEAAIAERIGHLPEEYSNLLSVASVQGELFIAETLANIQGIDEQEVIRILSQEISKRHRLVVAQSRRQIGGRTLSEYRFRHILFQKYLYQQLDQVEKASLNEKTGVALETLFAQDLNKFPDVIHRLARHFDLAGNVEKAVQYYTESGKYATQLGANREAISHYQRALFLVRNLPDSEKSDQKALGLTLSLGPPLTATLGWASPALEINYQQAEALCNKMTDNEQLVPVLWLLAVYRLGRSEHASVDNLVARLSKLSSNISDPGLLCLVNLQVSPLYQGKLTEARRILEHASKSRDVNLQRSLAIQYGMAPSAVGLAYLANCLWLLGEIDQAKRSSQEACSFAEELKIPMTICYAVSRACWQHAFAGNFYATRFQAEKLFQTSQLHEFRNFELAAQFFLHWSNIQIDHSITDEIDAIHQAMEEYQSLGTVLNRTTFLILFAQACVEADQIERGLAAIDEAIAFGERTGERWFEAEAYRVKGELLVHQAELSPGQTKYLNEAENCFWAAHRVASQQGAKMLELRADTSMHDLWKKQGKETNQIL